MTAETLQLWRKAGRPTGLWSARSSDAVESVRLGADEIAPVEVEILRTFDPASPCRFGRLRLLRARVAPPMAGGWSDVFLLGGEIGRAGETLQIPVALGLGAKTTGVLFTATALAAILPVEAGLAGQSDADLTDLYLAIVEEHFAARDCARKGVDALFHHEDELASVTVLACEIGGELRLAFGLEVNEEGATWQFEALRVPPSLRYLLKDRSFIEPGVPTSDVGRLLVTASALASGILGEVSAPGWEGALCPHSPRRLFTIETSAGPVAFGVGMDDCAKRPLREILDAKRAQSAG